MKTTLPLLITLLLAQLTALHAAEKVVIKNGWQLELPERRATLSVEPLEIYSATETLDLSKIDKLPWKAGFEGLKLKLSRPGDTTMMIYKALVPGSVNVSGPGREYRPETDFLVDEEWGRIGRAPNSAIPDGVPVTVDYRYTYARADLVELSAAGQVVLKKGATSRTQALPPEADPGATPLFTVSLSPGTLSPCRLTKLRCAALGPTRSAPALR